MIFSYEMQKKKPSKKSKVPKHKIENLDFSKKPSLKGKTVEDYKRIIEVLYAEIERKDRKIDELQHTNDVLMKTAIKAEDKVKNWEDQFERISGISKRKGEESRK